MQVHSSSHLAADPAPPVMHRKKGRSLTKSSITRGVLRKQNTRNADRYFEKKNFLKMKRIH